MSVTAAQLIAEVSTSGVEKTKSELQDVGETTTKTGGILKNALGGALSLATGAAGMAFGFLKGQLEESVKAAMDNQSVMAQTAQVIKSTGGVAGMTAQSTSDLAESLSKLTPFSEDAVQSGENLLLTFTGIGKQVFPEATKAMADLSQATGQDMKSSAIQLGKALNDPLTGLTALSRVGVSFSDAEKASIKSMVAHNDVIGAQKVELHELETEFGGSAEAAGKTLPGALAILKNTLEDVRVHIGDLLLPVLTKAATFLSGALTTAFDDVQKAIAYVGDVLRTVDLSGFRKAWEAIQPELATVRTLFEHMLDALNPLKNAATDFDPLADAIANLAQGGLKVATDLLRDFSGVILAVIKGLSQSGGLSDLGKIFREVGNSLLNLSPGVNLFQALSRHAQDLGKWFQASVVPALKAAEPGFASLGRAIIGLLPVLNDIANIVHNTFQKAFDALLPVFERIVPVVIYLAGLLAGALAQGIKFLAPYVVQAAAALGQFIDQVAKRVLPIVNQWIAQIHDFLIVWKSVWPYLAPLVKGAWDVIVGIVKVAWSLVSGIIKIGLDLLGGNWKQAWTDLKDMLGGVWDGIKMFIKGGLETINGLFQGLPAKALQWGKDMIQGFIDGISQMLGGLSDMAGNIASTISSHLHFSKPEVGPLADADQWMPDMMSMLSEGMNQNLGKLKSASLSVASTIHTGVQPGLTGGLSGLPQGQRSGPPIQIIVQPPDLTLDGRLLTNGLMPHIVGAIRASTGAKF